MELSSRYPEEGGIYVWTREAFGDFSGFICAWTYWMSNLPFFAGVLYFGAASALFAFGPRAQVARRQPALLHRLRRLLADRHHACSTFAASTRAKWLNNIGALGQPACRLSVLMLLAAVSCWRFGAAITFHGAPAWSPIGRWTTPSSGPASSSPSAALSPAPPWATRSRIPAAPFPGRCWSAAAFSPSAISAERRPCWLHCPARPWAGRTASSTASACSAPGWASGWLLVPMALLVALNAVGGAAANLSSTARLPFVVGIDRYLPAAFGWIHSALSHPLGRHRRLWRRRHACGSARPGGHHRARRL